MRIIEMGRTDLYLIKCIKCGSLIEFSESEEKHCVSLDGFYGMNDGSYIECPLCKSDTATRGFSTHYSFDNRTKV